MRRSSIALANRFKHRTARRGTARGGDVAIFVFYVDIYVCMYTPRSGGGGRDGAACGRSVLKFNSHLVMGLTGAWGRIRRFSLVSTRFWILVLCLLLLLICLRRSRFGGPKSGPSRTALPRVRWKLDSNRNLNWRSKSISNANANANPTTTTKTDYYPIHPSAHLSIHLCFWLLVIMPRTPSTPQHG